MTRPYQVVFADDEPIILRSLRVALPWEELGIEVAGDAHNGEEALRLIREAGPDIVISDIRMPVMDGIAMMKQAMAEHPATLFVLLSGYGEFEYAREAIRHGAFDYLLKPVDHEELEKVMREAKEKLDADAKRQSEQEILRSSVQSLSSLVRERLIGSMLEGNDKPYDRLYWLQGWEMEHPYLMLVVSLDDMLTLNRWGAEERKLWYFAVGNVLQELGEQHAAFTVFPFRSGEWVMLLQHTEQAKAAEIAEKLIPLVKACTKLSCSVGISSRFEGIDSLHECYRSAQRALLRRFAEGRERVCADLLPADGIVQAHAERRIGQSYASRGELPALESRLAEALTGFDAAAFAGSLGQWLVSLREDGIAQADASACFIELTVSLHRRLTDMGLSPSDEVPVLLASLPACRTLEEMGALFRGTFETYTQRQATDAGREEEKRSIRKALDYVSGRFHHDLGIDEVSEFVGLSCSHFCVLFKKETGVTFLEHLTRLRIERACSILRNADVKVYQIAPLVGYQDPKYFTNVFKKMTGMTPTEYRAACAKGAGEAQ